VVKVPVKTPWPVTLRGVPGEVVPMAKRLAMRALAKTSKDWLVVKP